MSTIICRSPVEIEFAELERIVAVNTAFLQRRPMMDWYLFRSRRFGFAVTEMVCNQSPKARQGARDAIDAAFSRMEALTD